MRFIFAALLWGDSQGLLKYRIIFTNLKLIK